MSRPALAARGFTVLIPSRGIASAKSRMLLPEHIRREMVEALLEDTIEAVSATPSVAHVVVVSPGGRTQAIAERSGAEWLNDAGAPGLNAAIGVGLALKRRRGAWPVAVVLGDLPFIDPADLDLVLQRAGEDRERPLFVPDLEGVGTTVLAADDPGRLAPGFGRGSAARHRSAGYREFADAPVSVRRDVDNLTDLAALKEDTVNGRGKRTAGVIEALGSRGLCAT
jgi:2-phospho-L-lactate guanylyltransferase